MYELLRKFESVEDRTALISIGRRSCEYIRQFHQALSMDSCAFLIDHDPESRQEDTPPADTFWINHVGIIPDFAFSEMMGIVIVGAEHQNPSEMYSFKIGLQKERPALLLGIVLPPPDGEPVRINSEFLTELDSVIWWPGDPALPEWGDLLFIAVNDWLAPLLGGGLICIDFSDMVCLFCGKPQPVVVTSVCAHPEQLYGAISAALTSLCQQGFKLDHVTGLLAVITVSQHNGTIQIFETVCDLISQMLPDSVTMGATMPLDEKLKDCARVTLFFANPSTGLTGACT